MINRFNNLCRHIFGTVDAVAQRLIERIDFGRIEIGARGARRHVEKRDGFTVVLSRQRLEGTAQRKLAGAVGSKAGIADAAKRRPDRYHLGRRRLAQQGQQVVRELQRRGHVEGKQPADFVGRIFGE